MRNTLIILASFALTACMASTANQIETSKVTDKSMSCQDIKTEITEMEEIIAKADSSKNAAHATNVGTAVAGHAAGLSGLPFVGAAISHSGSIANMGAAEREKLAEEAKDRKNALTGLYIGKDCS